MSDTLDSSVPSLKECLLDLSQPVGKRTHAAFVLRTIGSEEAVLAITEALQQKQDSSLMRHELAYILGQMQNTIACPILISILKDETDDILVRHEAAEALGAIGATSSLEVLTEFSQHSAPEISETCQIALDLIHWRAQDEKVGKSNYQSVDPAPPMDKHVQVDEMRRILLDTSKSLFQRYRAMFTLREMNTDESALALVDGFDDSSALFRHEIAYVLGQMQRPLTIEGLSKVLENVDEHRMVRHEAAEALGAIGGERVEAVLRAFQLDGEAVVKDSCDVALDTMEYWTSFANAETAAT
jgi:deoxyhypusine monooxygenase